MFQPSVARPTIGRGIALALLWTLAAAPDSARAATLISEVFYDAEGSDDGQTFVELYGEPGMALEEHTLEVVNGSNGEIVLSLALAGVVPADGLFVVADETSEGATQVPGADLLLDFDIQNGPDSLVLRDAIGTLDALGFGDFSGGEFFAGEGSPAPDAPAGASVARHFANLDTEDNGVDFGILEPPTPGAAEFTFVPEPSAGALACLGMLGLAVIGKRRPKGAARSEPEANEDRSSHVRG